MMGRYLAIRKREKNEGGGYDLEKEGQTSSKSTTDQKAKARTLVVREISIHITERKIQ